MSDEDREEALEQMRELFIQYPKDGKVVNELVKQLRNYSRRDINKNNNAIKAVSYTHLTLPTKRIV